MDSDCPDSHSRCVDDVIDEWTVPQHFGSQAFRSVIFVWWKPHWVMKEQVWFFMVKRCPITLHVLGTNRPGCSMPAFLLWSLNIIINDTILSGVQCRWHSLHDTHEERCWVPAFTQPSSHCAINNKALNSKQIISACWANDLTGYCYVPEEPWRRFLAIHLIPFSVLMAELASFSCKLKLCMLLLCHLLFHR